VTNLVTNSLTVGSVSQRVIVSHDGTGILLTVEEVPEPTLPDLPSIFWRGFVLIFGPGFVLQLVIRGWNKLVTQGI